MTNNVEPSGGTGSGSVDSVSIEKSYMDIPDTDNEAMIDAKTTLVVTVITSAVFIGIVFIFIL